jgi:uncharacterized protein (TIRG00374 family)
MLLYVSLHKLELKQVTETISRGNFLLVIPVIFISIIVYFFRVLRWELLFHQINQDIPKSNLTIALCIGYLVNFAIPRLGEVTRCAILKKLNATPINQSLTTVIFERTIDVITLLLITALGIILEYGNHSKILGLFINYDLIPTNQFIGFVIAFTALTIISLYLICKTENKIKNWLQGFWISIRMLTKIKSIFLFSIYTICIWICYFLMTYLWFFTFTESSTLSYYMAFQIMIVGSIARSIPLQAGSAGAYHYGVSQAFILLGISSITANALAIIIHGFQTIFTIIIGSLAYLAFVYKSKA